MDGQMFLIFVKISRTSLFFLECPPKILGGFTWMLQRSLQLVIVKYLQGVFFNFFYRGAPAPGKHNAFAPAHWSSQISKFATWQSSSAILTARNSNLSLVSSLYYPQSRPAKLTCKVFQPIIQTIDDSPHSPGGRRPTPWQQLRPPRKGKLSP